MFDRLSSKKPKTDESRKKKSKTEANEDFLAELNKLKAKKLKEKLASNSNDKSSTRTTDSPSKSENPKSESIPARDPPKETPTTEKSKDDSKEDVPLSKLTPRERLARLRAEKEAEDKKRLDAMADGKNSFDKVDMKLLFSQKW